MVEVAGSLELCLSAASYTSGAWQNEAGSVADLAIGSGGAVKQTYLGVESLFFQGGDDSFISSANVPSTICGTNPFTIEAWVRPTPSGTYSCAIEWGTSGSATRSGLMFHSVGLIKMVGGGQDANTASSVFSTTAWNYVVATFSGSGQEIFLDGVSRATASYAWNTPCGAPLNVGHNSGSTEWYLGNIATLRVHTGVMTSGQMATNYALGAGHATPCPAASVSAATVAGWSSSNAALRSSCVAGLSDCVTLLGSHSCDTLAPVGAGDPFPLLLEVGAQGRAALVASMVAAGCTQLQTDVWPALYQAAVDESFAGVLAAYE